MEVKEANKLCDNLLTNYDTTIILKYPKEIQDIFFKASKEKKQGNKTLLKLIRNLEKNMTKHIKQPAYDYISGPTIVYKMNSKKYDKIVYLFGETHGNKGCDLSKIKGAHIGIIDYLVQLFSTTPKFIDFYAEFSIKETEVEINENTHRMDIMLHTMKDYFRDIQCSYTVRLHSIDARYVYDLNHETEELFNNDFIYTKCNMHDLTRFVRRNLDKLYLDKYIIIFNKKFKVCLDMLEKIKSYSDIEKLLYDIIKHHKLLQKELSRSTMDPNIIVKFFVNHIISHVRKYNAHQIIYEWAKNIKNNMSINTVNVNSLLKILLTCILDIYAAARIFKKFNTISTSYQPNESHNIIYYTGSMHTLAMVDFMSSIGFDIIEKNSIIITNHCINMKGIQQPLFS